MFTKLDAALSPKIEETLTPYDKAARLMLAFALAGKLGSFDPTDLAHLNALEGELLDYERAVLNSEQNGIAGDLGAKEEKADDTPKPAEPAKAALKEIASELAKPAAPPSQTSVESGTVKK